MFIKLHLNREYLVSVSLQFIRRAYCAEKNLNFHEGIIYEDKLYTLKAFLLADGVMLVPQKLFHYRRRVGSTMTSEEGWKNFYGYFAVYCEMLKFLSESKWDDAVIREAMKEANECKICSLQVWAKLAASEKAGTKARMPVLYQALFNEMVGNGETENKNRRLSKELYDIRHGYSFRIGRMVTWFPRKLRGGIKCFRQHGVDYTAKRVLEHLGVDMGTGDFGRRK